MKKGYIENIEERALQNDAFRTVLYTAGHSQLVLMSLLPKQEIGEEVHDLDQFIRVEKGQGMAVIDGVIHEISDGFAIVIPEGARHNIINTSESEAMKLYTIYSPAHHKDGIIHVTKEQAETDTEHFDGITTE